MKALFYFSFLFLIFSCQPEGANDTTLKTSSDELNARLSFSAVWDICRPCNESNAQFRAQEVGTSNWILFTPSCGSPDCVDDGGGTLCSQASVIITISGGSLSYNNSTCTLNIPVGAEYSIRQISSGTCQSTGFDWDESTCTTPASGSIYIKSQVYPVCSPYVTNSTCIYIDPQ